MYISGLIDFVNTFTAACVFFSVYMLFLKRPTGLLQISLELDGKALLDLGMLRLDTSVSQWTKPAVTAGSAQLLSATAGAKSPMCCRKLHAFIDAKELITGTNWFLFCFYNLNLTYWELWRHRSSFWTQYHIPWEKEQVGGTALLFFLKPFWISLLVV